MPGRLVVRAALTGTVLGHALTDGVAHRVVDRRCDSAELVADPASGGHVVDDDGGRKLGSGDGEGEQRPVRRQRRRRRDERRQLGQVDDAGAPTRQVHDLQVAPPLVVPQDGRRGTVQGDGELLDVGVLTFEEHLDVVGVLGGGEPQESEAFGAVVAAHDEAGAIPVERDESAVGGRAVVDRHEGAPGAVVVNGQELTVAARADAEQRDVATRVRQGAAGTPVDDARLPRHRIEQAALDGALAVEDGDGDEVVVPADELDRLARGEVDGVRVRVVRVGGDEPDLLAVTTVRCDLAGEPVPVG